MVFRQLSISFLSHPAWVCGLKHYMSNIEDTIYDVTPCVGVWIETLYHDAMESLVNVTPCVGVWIET